MSSTASADKSLWTRVKLPKFSQSNRLKGAKFSTSVKTLSPRHRRGASVLGYGATSHGSATKEESYISKKERKFFWVHGPKISLHAVPCDVPSHGDLTAQIYRAYSSYLIEFLMQILSETDAIILIIKMNLWRKTSSRSSWEIKIYLYCGQLMLVISISWMACLSISIWILWRPTKARRINAFGASMLATISRILLIFVHQEYACQQTKPYDFAIEISN